jgi:branched-chain amino acid transport system substrate-binding protein
VVLSEEAESGTTDFSSFVSAVRASRAQAVFALGNATDDKICVARAQLGTDIAFLGTDEFAGDPVCLTQAADNTASIFATKPDVDLTVSTDSAAVAEVQKFRDSYPTVAPDEYTFAAYDSAQILIAAIEKAVEDNHGSVPNRRQVLDVMAQIQYAGLTGTYSFDADGDARAPLMSIVASQNGQWVNQGKIDAAAAPA